MIRTISGLAVLLCGLSIASWAETMPGAAAVAIALDDAPSAPAARPEDPAVKTLNASIIRHQETIDAQNKAAAAAYEQQLAAYRQQLKAAAEQQAAVQRQYAAALASHAAAVKACAAGELDRCGGPPMSANRAAPVAAPGPAPSKAVADIACRVDRQTGSLVKTHRSCRKAR